MSGIEGLVSWVLLSILLGSHLFKCTFQAEVSKDSSLSMLYALHSILYRNRRKGVSAIQGSHGSRSPDDASDDGFKPSIRV